ncbi:(4Fe-4S)-binding protein [Corynebacterium caspium]|uniref:(4Fe-4S)-binding protein n=1 Tax=Corynebacterium caspium TaxID=234828 RepID=UPI00036F9F79|nr:(4Fe-4S)-binding protein [Corynebacterium caspium]WKD59036.1 hypothetical protein CCASP_03160 [Corynebacterium caspium DSM 44850]
MTTKTYENDDLTVFWKPELCQHAAECVRGSKAVFDPTRRPWIKLENGTSEQIAKIIDKCPSFALSYAWKEK